MGMIVGRMRCRRTHPPETAEERKVLWISKLSDPSRNVSPYAAPSSIGAFSDAIHEYFEISGGTPGPTLLLSVTNRPPGRRFLATVRHICSRLSRVGAQLSK